MSPMKLGEMGNVYKLLTGKISSLFAHTPLPLPFISAYHNCFLYRACCIMSRLTLSQRTLTFILTEGH